MADSSRALGGMATDWTMLRLPNASEVRDVA